MFMRREPVAEVVEEEAVEVVQAVAPEADEWDYEEEGGDNDY